MRLQRIRSRQKCGHPEKTHMQLDFPFASRIILRPGLPCVPPLPPHDGAGHLHRPLRHQASKCGGQGLGGAAGEPQLISFSGCRMILCPDFLLTPKRLPARAGPQTAACAQGGALSWWGMPFTPGAWYKRPACGRRRCCPGGCPAAQGWDSPPFHTGSPGRSGGCAC